jgi:SAM-dependent methyltransferase
MSLVVPLGDHPVANAFLAEEELSRPEPRFPLDLYVCGRCALLQIGNQVPPGFFRHYLYVPSAADTGRRHFAGLASWLVDTGLLPAGGRIIDVGCNDGLFLASCVALGAQAIGIDPASNLAPVARSKGVTVIEEYLTPEVAREVRERHGAADVLVATNTLNHIDDLRAFTESALALLGPDGAIVIEVPRASELIEHNEIDTVYHEHLSQFSLRSLCELFAPFDLVVSQVHAITMHGGSMRVIANRRGRREVSPAVDEWLAAEQRAGLFDPGTYDAFRGRLERNRDALVAMLGGLVGDGCRIAGYGAPAKGNTLLNYCKIGPDTLAFLADRNPLKHGRYSPGMHVPIVPASRIDEAQPDCLLVLAWNFFDEIREQQAAFRARGGRFVVPIPVPTLVT